MQMEHIMASLYKPQTNGPFSWNLRECYQLYLLLAYHEVSRVSAPSCAFLLMVCGSLNLIQTWKRQNVGPGVSIEEYDLKIWEKMATPGMVCSTSQNPQCRFVA